MINFDPWNQLLRQYVDEQGCVNYRTWKTESFWQLQDWLTEAGSQWEPDLPEYERLAFWLNIYNAVTIAKVLQQYPILSIQPQILGFPNWIGFFWFFLRPSYSLRRQRYSLYQIENSILRKQFKEPRIHFAIVCASVGCPLLRNAAYYPDTVIDQLQEDGDRFINNPDKVYYSEDSQTLYCSQIFKWYRKDFLQQSSSIPTYIRKYLRNGDHLTDKTPVRFLPYDWSLNGQTLDVNLL